jgi:hypothetical protein
MTYESKGAQLMQRVMADVRGRNPELQPVVEQPPGLSEVLAECPSVAGAIHESQEEQQ